MYIRKLSNVIFIDIVSNGQHFRSTVRNDRKYAQGIQEDFAISGKTDLELDLLSCSECDGLLREACFSQGSNFCKSCSEDGTLHTKIDENVSKLQVKCPLEDRGCGWKGLISELLGHTEECGYVLVSCTLDCEDILPRGDLEMHLQQHCPLREVTCKLCGEIGLARDQETHVDICPMFLLECPQECGDKVARGEIEEHITVVCTMSEVECPFSALGCDIILFRKDVSDHVESSVAAHQGIVKDVFIRHDETIRQQNETIRQHDETIQQQNETIRQHDETIQQQNEKLLEMENKFNDLERRVTTQMNHVPERVKCLEGVVWRIEELTELVEAQADVEGPLFALDRYSFRCMARYNPDRNCVAIYMKRIGGNNNGTCLIKHLKIVLVNIDDTNNTIEDVRNVLHELSIGKLLPLMTINYPIQDGFIQDDSLVVRLYFELV